MASDDMSGMERFTAGAGYGAKSTIQGVGQIGERLLSGTDAPADAGILEQIDALLKNSMGPGAGMRAAYRTLTTPEQRSNARGAMQGQINEDRRLYDEGLGKTGEGFAGNLAGAVGMSAPLGVASIPATGISSQRSLGLARLRQETVAKAAQSYPVVCRRPNASADVLRSIA
jgi:hypothetical protein